MPTATKPTVVENIQVLQVGKYGVRVDEKTWFGVNEPLTPSHFVPNEGYKVSVTVSKTGKKYINEILGQEQKQDAPAPQVDSVKEAEEALAKAKLAAEAKAVAAKAEAAAHATPASGVGTQTTKNPTRSGFGTPLTDYDLAIQRQISRAGVIQAALTSPALAQWSVNVDEYLALVRKVSDFAFKYVGE